MKPIIWSEKTKHNTAKVKKNKKLAVKKVLNNLFTCSFAFSLKEGIIFEKTATVALWTAFPTICVTCHAGKTFEFKPV